MASGYANSQILSPNVRQVLTNISQRLFYHETSDYNRMKDKLPGNEIATSLPLQMSMYFNVFFFPFWITSTSLMLSIKYDYLDPTYKVLLIAVLIIFSFIEIIRLYLGYVGNLQEKVPEVAGFLLLTILPQLPLVLFLLLNESMIILPLERAVHIVLLTLILIEIVSAWSAAVAMSRHQATKFHLQQFVDLEQLPVNDVYGDPNAPVARNRMATTKA